MKSEVDKDKILELLEGYFKSGEGKHNDDKEVVERFNNNLKTEWEQQCKEAEHAHKELPEDWWKQFVSHKVIKSTDKLIFNETKTSEEFDRKSAEDYLKSKCQYLQLNPSPRYYDYFPCPLDLYASHLQDFKIRCVIKNVWGQLREWGGKL